MTDTGSLEEQLQESQRLASIGLFAAGIAHDFNNVLTVILSTAALLGERLSDRSEAREELRELEVAANWGAALTKQLLAFARRQVRQPQFVDVTELTTHTERLLRRLIGEHIELTTTLVPLPGPIWADPAQVEQVLVNLGLNARDAMPGGGRLKIATSAVQLDPGYAAAHPDVTPGHYVAITISDTGHGMTPDIMARLSEPLFTTKAKDHGTGLGLTISYGMVRQNGGHIVVSSEPGIGTIFRLYFPLVEHAAASQPLSPSDMGPGGTETILLAEDEAVVRSVAARTLHALGYTVLEASHGLEALEVAERYPGHIHLLITDVVMPHLNGKELADGLRRNRPELRVLFTSGYPADILTDAKFQPEVHWLSKPYDGTSLAHQVRKALQETR
jgi:nitrogen-specific signal transduction histidine kinase/CheY-like chemotaxis protein